MQIRRSNSLSQNSTRRRRRIIGNRKQLLLAEKAEKQKELMERINVGDVVRRRC